ncbi:hypothetical protein N7535_007664 [Penicillium sp. DV-2018c]|nr:hypothetical protein N7535_007664 [Penicillium sp. DV-2018c]
MFWRCKKEIFFSLGVSVASWLLLGKEWLHAWFPRLWPQPEPAQNDQAPETPIDASMVWGVAEDTLRQYERQVISQLTRRIENLEGRISAERPQTLDPPEGEGQAGPSNGTGTEAKTTANRASAQPSLEKPLPTWLDELNTWRVKSLPGEPKLSTLRKALTKQALPMKVGCWTL